MNFIISSTSLLRHLQSIGGAISTNNSLPILDNFLFQIESGKLTITASDLQTTMQTFLEVEASEDFRICIPGRTLIDVLKNLPEQPCTFTIAADFSIEIKYDNGRNKMAGYDGGDYPALPKFEAASSVKISSEILSKAISKTIFATGTDDLRPILGGVFCQFNPSELTFVATDAHKLVRYTRTDSQAKNSASFILPKKPLTMLKACLSGDQEVLIEYTDANAVFTFGEIILTCRLIDGKYPNYEGVIPKENPNELVVDRAQFLGALKRVSVFSNKTTHQVRLSIAGSEMQISAEDIDYNNSANERMNCNYVGDDMEIAFNSRFLMEMITNLNSTEVRIKMSEPSRAGLLMPAIPEEPEEDVLMLVMPVTSHS